MHDNSPFWYKIKKKILRRVHSLSPNPTSCEERTPPPLTQLISVPRFSRLWRSTSNPIVYVPALHRVQPILYWPNRLSHQIREPHRSFSSPALKNQLRLILMNRSTFKMVISHYCDIFDPEGIVWLNIYIYTSLFIRKSDRKHTKRIQNTNVQV